MKKIIKAVNEYKGPIIWTVLTISNLMQCLYILLQTDKVGDSSIIMLTPEKTVYQNFLNVSDKLKEKGIKNYVILKDSVIQRALGLSDIKNYMLKKRIYNENTIKKKNFLLVNFAWDLSRVFYPASIYYKECERSVFIQEGLLQYVTPVEPRWKLIIKKLYGNQLDYWIDKKLIGIFVQKPAGFPDYLQNKIQLLELNYDEIHDSKFIEDFCSIFLSKEDYYELELIKKANGIIFSQPISEDKYVSESEKVRIYSDIVNYYSKEGKIVFKVHPRDETEYVLRGAEVVRGKFPSELLKLMGIRFDFAVGLCTSAIETVDAQNKINLNEKFLEELTYELKRIT